ncbi:MULTISPECIES: zf-HC2 domain-containing protein [unclassified Myxococcus]|uniref:zf-HC2 domain-containing protein n=1 Tax=unclassified Myxococcus TaxID=2648731 RepID=UPI00157AC404|nr:MULTISPECIES: zf-HC2 domain-containing protein [unclassified Myxococcus]NTX04357.1 zf-HC2 domain-containing protein [Myxococcus sp. CA040A]NTX50117.1 zf-HC2 domain-containing protein [Myxococcus sp. CA039A]
MAACPDQEARVDLHAAGALEASETVALLHHLESCAGCREAFAASVEVLSLLTLPAPTAAEKHAQEALPQRALDTWKRERMSQALRRRTVGSLVAAAAAVAVMVLVPGIPRPWDWNTPPEPQELPSEERAVEARALADFEAWAGLEPLEASSEWEDEEALDDVESWDEEALLGETL